MDLFYNLEIYNNKTAEAMPNSKIIIQITWLLTTTLNVTSILRFRENFKRIGFRQNNFLY